MNKEFIPYEQALALKELGFDGPCFGYYVDGELRGINLGIKELGGKEPYYQRFGFHVISNLDIDNATKVIIAAPTFSQAFRWFREKYELHSTITSISQESWQWHITKPGESLGKLYDEDFYTYEEAELECLKKLIQIVKEKK